MFSCLLGRPSCSSSAVGSRALRARREEARRRGGRAREDGGSGKNQSPVSATSSFSARRCRGVQGHFLHVTPPPLALFLFENRTMARVSVRAGFLPAHDASSAASFFPRWRGSGNACMPLVIFRFRLLSGGYAEIKRHCMFAQSEKSPESLLKATEMAAVT